MPELMQPQDAAQVGNMALERPALNARKLAWLAEWADGERGKNMVLVLTAGGEYRLKEKDQIVAGDTPILPVHTDAVNANRLKPEKIILQAPGGTPHEVPADWDALFWTESAIEKFLFPYYFAQRIMEEKDLNELLAKFRTNPALVAISHVAPSRAVLVPAGWDPAADGTLAVLKANSQQDKQIKFEWTPVREILGRSLGTKTETP